MKLIDTNLVGDINTIRLSNIEFIKIDGNYKMIPKELLKMFKDSNVMKDNPKNLQ